MSLPINHLPYVNAYQDSFPFFLSNCSKTSIYFSYYQAWNNTTHIAIIKGSPVDRCRVIRVGDLVTEVNGINIARMSKLEITNMFMDSGDSLVLTIGGIYKDTIYENCRDARTGETSQTVVLIFQIHGEDFNFKTTLLLKWHTIFDKLSLDGDPKFDNFIWLQLILGQKPCFLGPIQLFRWKVNIHYYV